MTETRLLLATKNPGKVREIRRALRGLPVRVFGLEDVLPGLSHAERGRTFSANARSKSLFYGRKWDGLSLAEDSGLEIDALGGAPGVRSARFSGPKPSDEKNNEMWEVLEFAFRTAQESDGLVTPAILPALERAGYDRTFDEINRLDPPPAQDETWDTG